VTVVGAVNQGVPQFAQSLGKTELADVLTGAGRKGETLKGSLQCLYIGRKWFVETIYGEIFKPHDRRSLKNKAAV